jgi:hypothetical protein
LYSIGAIVVTLTVFCGVFSTKETPLGEGVLNHDYETGIEAKKNNSDRGELLNLGLSQRQW